MNGNELVARIVLTDRDQEISQNYADQLSQMDFKIKAIMPRGVIFSGNMALFEKIFRAKIEVAKEQAMFLTIPVIPDQLKQKTESVYFPTKPTFLRKGENHGKRNKGPSGS